jgi:hypothetical protein
MSRRLMLRDIYILKGFLIRTHGSPRSFGLLHLQEHLSFLPEFFQVVIVSLVR